MEEVVVFVMGGEVVKVESVSCEVEGVDDIER